MRYSDVAAQLDIDVDDLEEVFLEPGFPQHVEGILFDPVGTINTKANVIVKNSWQDIQDHLLAT